MSDVKPISDSYIRALKQLLTDFEDDEEYALRSLSMRQILARLDAAEGRAHLIEGKGVIERLRAGTATADEQFDVANSLCYLWAQGWLLSEAQEAARKAESDLASARQPLDAQMARLNETLIAANSKNVSLARDLNAEIAAREAAERERDQYRDTLLSRHGGECLALLSELDAAREECDQHKRENEALRAAIAKAADDIEGWGNYASECLALLSELDDAQEKLAAAERENDALRAALHSIALTDDEDCWIANDAKAMTRIARAALAAPAAKDGKP